MRRWIVIALAALAVVLAGHGSALAQKTKKPKPAAASTAEAPPAKKGAKKQRVYDFGAFGIEGSMRTPQLLYFLGRAKQELDRASLEKRSFMPELTRSVDEGGL